MQIFRGGALVALLLALAGLAAPAAHAQSEGVRITADVSLGDDGLLRVVETVEVPEGGDFRQVLPLRVQVSDTVERNFEVTEVQATGDGTAKVDDNLFTIEARPGSATFKYAVHNTVSNADGAQVFHWTGVLNTDVASISASVISPDFRMGVTKCTIGPPGAPENCADIRVEPDGVAHLTKTDLRKGDVIDVTLQLPPGTVKANADIHDDNAPGPFSLTGPVLAAFAVLLAGLAAAAGYVVWTRRADADAPQVIDPIAREGNRARFTSPDGVLPGTAGLLLDGYVDPADMAATIVDLAVRSYLWVAVADEQDWRIERLNPADDQLTGYERTVYSALLPDGVDAVLLSELKGKVPVRAVRRALIDDAVARGAFVDRTRRGFEFWLGAALILTGAIATAALALGPGHALIGIAIALAGVAALLLPRYLPARTALGRELTGRIQAMLRGLDAIAPQQLPPPDQELVFSRALPFMVAGRRTDQWVRTFRNLDPTADGETGIYWFGGFEGDRELLRFGAHFPYFITAVEGLFRPAR
ncbi:DUF2207 domain-containing protein [Nocardia yamanashiensis]|uniref:DUF2207 family protein n=1 Tax=Nocardia yamanashiensis TaxID=209247 RepID=UPI001E38A991|nr:DUF2207 domain-containing protein [Nocardia yamanashiensis]UGT40267.1 DUF2207 domain-containing protein [Nocardia yamanashiensis]